MQTLFESTREIQTRLSEAGIASAVIGGLAVSVWAKSRLTHDADIRVFLERDQDSDSPPA